MTALPVRRAHELDVCPEERRWLIEGLWSDEAVGILGGEPKCCKSFLALDMAVAVAAGVPCLRRFPALRAGRVLLFAAEDSHAVVHRRLSGIASAVGVPLENMDIHVIVAPVLRLDVDNDRRRLEQTIVALSPKLLVLDPFVRLHRVDENVSAEVAPLLDFLRGLQRRHHVAVVLVHHARKGASHIRAGQALRGSSELHAWGDSNLYVRRGTGDDLFLTIEHRAAPSTNGIPLELCADDDALALRVVDCATPDPGPSPERATDRIERILLDAKAPMTRREIRDAAKVRASTVGDALATLVTDGRATRLEGRYQPVRR